MTKPVLLYFYPVKASFVVKDISLLEKEYNVIHKGFFPKHKWQTPLVWLEQFLFLLYRIWKADVLVSMFAGYHSFFPALFGKIMNKPCLIIAGGTDCVSFPSINYGCFSKPILSKFTRWSYQLATHIAPVHEKLMWQEYTFQPNDFPFQGLHYHCAGLKTPYTVIYNGYDANFWKPVMGIERKPAAFLTIFAGRDERYKLKGVDLILEVAFKVPEATFTIVGVSSEFPVAYLAPNVSLLPKMSLTELTEIYSAHAFYLQLSLSEGFPNALCESMLCGCVPIVSKVGGMPDIIADSGFVLEERNVDILEMLLKNTLKQDIDTYGQKARAQIRSHYPEERRGKTLSTLLRSLCR